MEAQMTPNDQTTLINKIRPGRISLLNLRLYDKAMVINTVCCWHRGINIDQQNNIESPDINPQTYGHFIFDKGYRNITWIKNILLSKWCCENQTATCKRMKLEYFLTPYTKISLKWIKDLNVMSEIIKVLEEKIGSILFDRNHSKILSDPPPTVMEIKSKINKWELI